MKARSPQPPPRPVALPVSATAIPDQLKALPQWVTWRYTWLEDRQLWDKPPKRARTGKAASSTNPKTWSPFADALSAYERSDLDGVGFAPTEANGLVGVDLDHCRDPDTGVIEDWALAIVTRLDTYAEVSPSGTGLRLWARGTLPPRGRKKGHIEVYSHGHYLTVTGNHLRDTPATIEARQAALDALHAEVFGQESSGSPQAPPYEGNGHRTLLDDDVLVEKALAAKNGAKFAQLWAGDTSDYPSPSEADLALCALLAFWTQDPAQLDRLFRRSQLFRDKWDEAHGETTYGARTIATVLSQDREHWTPGSHLGNGQPPGAEADGDWLAQLSTTKGGDVRETLGNVTLALQHLPPWATACWYDVVRDLRMVGDHELDDTMVTTAGLTIEATTGMPIRSTHLIPTALTYLCHQHPRDLLRERLEALPPWDGMPRLTTWLTTYAHAEPRAYAADLSRLLPVSMVARALDPGCQYRFVVILEGPEDTGKTKLVRALATPAWYRELSHGLDGKEAHMRIKRAWVAELAELSSLSRTEESRLKSFFTLNEDAYIPKFSNFEVVHQRRTVFIGTVNPEGDNTYLRGQTGNTRYLPIGVYDINLEGFEAVRDQLFAEALQYYRDHPADWWQLSSDGASAAEEAREERRQRSVYEDDLGAWLERTRKAVTWWEQLAQDYLQLPRERWADRRLQMEVAKALKALGWYKDKRERQGDAGLIVPWRPGTDWHPAP